MTGLQWRSQRRSAHFIGVALLALFAHLAAMSTPVHARVMAAAELADTPLSPHMVADHDPEGTPERSHHSAPASPRLDACGFAASLPAVGHGFVDLVGVVLNRQSSALSLALLPPCSTWVSHPPPQADRQALLQVFRL
ncbi:MAG: hypothetical protein ACKVVP_12400 [Chloroflexota bacterium]